MKTMRPNMLEALKARAEKAKAKRKEISKEEAKKIIEGSAFFKALKEARERKLNKLNEKLNGIKEEK